MDDFEEGSPDRTDQSYIEDEDSGSDYVPDEEKPSRHSRRGRRDRELSASVEDGREAETDEEMEDVDEDEEFAEPGALEGAQDAISEIFESSSSSEAEDTEFYTLQPAVARFERKIQRTSNEAERWDSYGPSRRRGAKRRKRGPRKPVEPSLEVQLLLGKANDAFISRNLETAEELVMKVIMANAETYAAYVLLSGILLERGQTELGIIAQMSAAHLRPNDPTVWQHCIDLILEKGRENRASFLKDAIYCYTRMVHANPKDVASRYQKAMLLSELDLKAKAAQELELLLKMLPHDPTVLKQLAEVYVDLGDIEKAKQRYRQHMTASMDPEEPPESKFTWSDVNIYVELFAYEGQYKKGIVELKSLARWLLGRESETYWDDVQEDDREWDADDYPRRIEVPRFRAGRFPKNSYGYGLPLELRIKLGIYRLRASKGDLTEAMVHFNWISPEDSGPGAKLYDYPDLFEDVADALQSKGHYVEALKFYEPLLKTDANLSSGVYTQMGMCYQKLGLVTEAENSYLTAVQNDDNNIDARVQLARIYEAQGQPEQALIYVNEVLALDQQGVGPSRRRRRRREPGSVEPAAAQIDTFIPAPVRKPSTRKRKSIRRDPEEAREAEQIQEDASKMHYIRLQTLEERMESGDEEATRQWMEAASVLTEDFRSAKAFYPAEKYMKFLGYSREARVRASKSQNAVVADMQALGDRLQATLEEALAAEESEPIPTNFRGIEFVDWLDVFLKYALCLARQGDRAGAYEMLSAADDANVFHDDKQSTFLIHICWAACALSFKDDETIANLNRWFDKEYQFVTDVYRLHAALDRLCHNTLVWYYAGPVQKFVLRQVKAMDYRFMDEETRAREFGDKGSYTSRDEHGQPIVNEAMDTALLVLYGHMLYSASSFQYGLNYYHRAHALDPTNPAIYLFLGLSYIQHGLKRQSANRHQFLVQGYHFMFEYYDNRQKFGSVREKQEAEYNMGRTYHMIGLAHLAIPHYEKTLQLSELNNNNQTIPNEASSQANENNQDFAREAAYNLQSLYAMSGNMQMAQKVTEKYLVI